MATQPNKPKPKSAVTTDEKRLINRVIKQQQSITRKDMADWKAARQQATNATEPKQVRLQTLYDEIMLDALMTSQIGLRIDKSQAADFALKLGDVIDEEQTKLFRESGLFDSLVEYIIEGKFYSCSVIEFSVDSLGFYDAELIDRTNISPSVGRFYPNTSDSNFIEYRQEGDYGSWIVEFYPRQGDLGLLNKAVPYVLIKRFALSCWSELCEIFGIPPRVMKTNTADKEMLDRAEYMMREIGSAAFFIVDTTEDIVWADAVNTNGDIFRNIISVCDQQISLINLAAVLGQDTLNGNRSKEESSSKLLESVVRADNRFIEKMFNRRVLPALAAIGMLKPGLKLEIAKELDIDRLWKMVYEGSQYYDFDIDWVRTTFGIEVTGSKSIALPAETDPQKGAPKSAEPKNSLDDFFV